MKNLLVAPNSFKGCAESVKVANLINFFLEKTPNPFKNIELCPISDGGDGFLKVVQYNLRHFETLSYRVRSYYSDDLLEVEILYQKEMNIIYIESAKVFGLALNSTEQRNPLYYNTVSLGELIKSIQQSNLIDHTRELKIIAGFGGSGTNDLGMGVASVFGLKLFDEAGNELLPLPVNFPKVRRIIPPNKLQNIQFEIIFDVDIPLLGEKGPSLEYSIQKGASWEQALLMEGGNGNIISLLTEITGIPGLEETNGAAGGTALGLSLISDVRFTSSRKFLTEFLKIGEKIQVSDVVITGEGKFDRQSFMEKGTGIIHGMCKEMKKKLFIICGEAETEAISGFQGELIRIKKEGEAALSAIENFPSRTESAIREIIYKLNN